VILYSGAKLLWASAQELMDAQADASFVAQIRATAAAVAGVEKIDKLWVRKSGLEYLVDIHIQVPADQTVAEGHRISHLVKDTLLDHFTNLRDVLVHLEPYPHPHERDRNVSGEA
jgi:divalent metal cation (Fe/Co/Zn/Cd) transporter